MVAGLLVAVALCSAVSEGDHAVAVLGEAEVDPVDLRAQALKKVENLIDTKSQGAEAGVAATDTVMDHKKMAMLEDEVRTLKQEQATIAEKTATDLRASLNQQKEVYFKKMQKASSPTARERRIAGRAAVQVAQAMDKAGKYRAINKVLTAKAGFAGALQKTVKKLVAKMDAALSATEMMTEKTEKDAKEIKDLKAQVAGLELQVEKSKNGGDDSGKGLTIEKQIKREKKLAREAHKEAAKHSREAADGHAAAGDDSKASKSAKNAKDADAAANSDKLNDKAEDDEEKAEAEEEKAKSLEKKANKAKKKAEKEKAAAKKVKAAKKKAEKAEEAAEKAKDEADDAGDDDSDDELGGDDSADDVDSDTAKAMQSDNVEADANEDADDEAEEDDDDSSSDDLDLASFQ